MNYSELSEIYNDEKPIKIINTNNHSNNPKLLLDEYELLNNSLKEHNKQYEDLMANNIYFINYLNSSQNNHFNIIKIIDDLHIKNSNDSNDSNDSLTNVYINYNEKVRENYKKWYDEYYNPRLTAIENNIEIINDKITDYRNFFIYIANEIIKDNNDINNKKLCPICFENEVDICLNPCGHTLCNKCILSNRNRNITNICYSCRTITTDYIKIYFSI